VQNVHNHVQHSSNGRNEMAAGSPAIKEHQLKDFGIDHNVVWEARDFPKALEALHQVHGNHSHFKSPEQAQLIDTVLKRQIDVLCILRTGGGKSLAWEATALTDHSTQSIVIVGSKKLLEQHIQRARALGIPSLKYTSGCGLKIPSDVRLLFMALETVQSKGFQMYVIT
jgi:superfamily II DNA helicase RecQ